MLLLKYIELIKVFYPTLPGIKRRFYCCVRIFVVLVASLCPRFRWWRLLSLLSSDEDLIDGDLILFPILFRKYLLRQTRLVSTSILLRVLRQTYLFRDKHNFIATKRRILSRQTRVCRDKTVVAAKMTLVAAPANDIPLCRSHSALPVSSKRFPCRPTRLRAFQTMPRSQDAGFSSSLKPVTVLKYHLFFQTERQHVTSDGPGQDAGDRVHHLHRDCITHRRPEYHTKHGV